MGTVGAALGTRPWPVALALGPATALKHLLEDSAEPRQEATAEVVVGAGLVSLTPGDQPWLVGSSLSSRGPGPAFPSPSCLLASGPPAEAPKPRGA